MKEEGFMATATQASAVVVSKELPREVVSRIVSKFQTTVPQEIRDLFGLREGDFFEWHFDAQLGHLIVIPKRTQLITPRLHEKISQERSSRPSAVAVP
jgi:bifunctional DNA-binding transcriptional regulator/antitoxin component of YhaV-PrlF toxin-antitoxin module